MYKLIKEGKQFRSPIKKYICNTYNEVNDIKESIPFSSVLYVVDTYKYYIYNSKKQWIEVKGQVDYV